MPTPDYSSEDLNLTLRVLISSERFLRLHQVSANADMRDEELLVLKKAVNELAEARRVKMPEAQTGVLTAEELGTE